MDVVGRPADRQSIEAPAAGLAVDLCGHVERVGIEQVEDGTQRVTEVDELVVVSPPGHPDIDGFRVQEIGWCPRLNRGHGFNHDLILWLDELDLLPGFLLEHLDDLADRIVRLRVVCPLPPDNEVGATSA
jgi:hypothetical protein